MRRGAIAFSIALGVAATAHATPTRQECIQASEDAQLLRIKGQLGAARAKLVDCSSSSCPKVVRNDCSQWLDEVDRAMPTIVLGAHDGAGKDLALVHVTLDGAPLVDHLDGKAIAVDPGAHKLRFEAEGLPPLEQSIIVREGEKDRIVSVVLGKPVVAETEPPPVPRVAPVPTALPVVPVTPVARTSGPSPATWVVGALGLAVLGAAGVVGAVSLGERQSLYDSCGSTGTCRQSDVDGVYLMYDLAYAGAAIGGALVATSIVLFFATRHRVIVTPTVGGLAVLGRF